MNVVNSRIKLKHNVLQNMNSIITQFVTFAIYKFMRHIAREAWNVIILLLLTKKRSMNKRKELYLQRINNALIYNCIAIKAKSFNTDHTKKTYRETSWETASLLDNEASKWNITTNKEVDRYRQRKWMVKTWKEKTNGEETKHYIADTGSDYRLHSLFTGWTGKINGYKEGKFQIHLRIR